MNRRRAIAILALLGALDAGYLLLAKLGITGPLSCSISRGCEMVNMSEYSVFLGIPVSAIGLAGYLAILALAIAGTLPRWVPERWPDLLLTLLSGIALVFTLYLTYAEFFVLRAICQWCVASQVIVVAICVLSVIGLRRARAG